MGGRVASYYVRSRCVPVGQNGLERFDNDTRARVNYQLEDVEGDAGQVSPFLLLTRIEPAERRTPRSKVDPNGKASSISSSKRGRRESL